MAQIVKLRRSSVLGQKPTNTNLQLGELALNTADGKVFMAKSGSLGPTIEELIITNTINTGSVNISGSINLDGNQTITGSLIVTNGVGYINTGLISENSDLLLTSGSNIYVQDGGIISGSALQGDGSGIINIPLSGVTNLTTISSSFDNRINQITGSVDSLNTFTSSVVLTSQTSSMTVLSASYAVTAAFALNAGGSGGASLGSYSVLDQTVASTTWSFDHNVGQRYPIFQVFNSDGDVIIPTQIRTIDENNAEIIFGSEQTGKAIASLGGGNGTTEEFTNSDLWVVDHNLGTDYPDVTIWDSNRNIIFADRIESVNKNQIKIYFSIPVSGYVSVSRGGHILLGSLSWDDIENLPSGIVSSSDQLTSSYDTRYVLSGSITQTTWDNIANKPAGIVSGSIQVDIIGTTGYSTFSESISSSISQLSSSVAITTNDLDNRIDFLETESGSIRSDLNSYTSSTNIRLNSLESISSSLLLFSSSVENAFEFTGSNVTIKGDLLVKGTETKVDSTTIQIGNNIIELNGSGATNAGLVVRDATNPNTISGSLLWDATNDYWIAGPLGSEERIILNGEFNVFTSSTNSTITSINNTTNSLNLHTSSTDIRLNSIETESSSIRNEFNSFTSSYNTGAFTGSFIGDGSQLTNIPASGVTGLQLDKIADGSATASISSVDGFVVNTNTTITGSLNVTGSIILNGDPVGTGKLDSTEFYTYTSSVNPKIGSLETESGSIRFDFNSYTSSTDIRINSLETESGSIRVELNSFTSSTDGRLDSLEEKTGSYATTGSNSFIGNENINGNLSVTGSVVISGSLDISEANVGSSRYLHIQDNTSATWSILHNLGYNYPNVTVYDGSNNKIMLPADVLSIDANTTEVTFATPEYGYALISVGGITTATADRFLFTATSATGSWVIDHNLGYKYVNIDVYDENDEQLIPEKVTVVSINRTQVDFATPTSGNAIITLGGPRSTSIFNQTGSFYSTQYNIGITGSLVVTGDVDAANFNTTSDKKLKTNLERIESALDKIDQINGYTFNWLQSYKEDDGRQIGMIANEVYEVQPELTSKRTIMLGGKEEEIILLDYSKVTALLIEAVKELNNKVKKLENKRNKK